jgi:transposase
MLSLLPGGRILVAVAAVDGRKGIDSLAGVVRSVLQGDPLSSDLFVFKTRRGIKIKILAWMGDGFALYLRKLASDCPRIWSYIGDVLDQLAPRSADADVSDLLPDARAVRHARLN